MYLLKPGCFIPVELFSYRCMAAPSSSMTIVDFIPQSGTMNLATATNVVFHYFLYFSSPFEILQKD
jgi:hypothetical protein